MLLGVLETLEEEFGPLDPMMEGSRRRRLLDALAEELDTDGLAAAISRGKEMSRDEAIELTASD